MSNIAYSAVVLDDASHKKLVESFSSAFSEDLEIIAHHMTINMGELDSNFKKYLGNPVNLEVISFAKDDLVVAVGVRGFSTTNEIPHITLAVNRRNGGKPYLSNKLKTWTALPTPISIKGTVQEVPR